MSSESTGLITREPRHRETIERWRAFWALEDVGRPLWLAMTLPGTFAVSFLGYPMIPFLKEKERQLRGELAFLGLRERLQLGDDFVPHLQPHQGTSVFASAFGCPVSYFDHTLPWAHPVIGADDPPERVYDLPAPKVTDGQLGDMLDFTRHFVAETQGRYPIAQTDLQGPLDTAYLVWDSCSFMTAMYTNPKEVHHLMRLVTDLIVAFVKEQRALSPEFIPCHFPPLYLPDGEGIAISEDCLAVIGADLYREFALPYNNELSEEFGGLFVHSCGAFGHQLENLKRIRNLRGLNFGATEMAFEPVWEEFGGRTAVVPHLGLNKDIHFDDMLDYVRHVLSVRTTDRGLCVVLAPTDPAAVGDPVGFAATMRAAYELAEVG